jgi:hypothetical protein
VFSSAAHRVWQFPPMQKGASFNLQAVKEQVEAAIAKGKPGN